MPNRAVSAECLSVQRVHFQTTFLDDGRVSRNWGPTLRGGFGRALRDVACSLNRDNCTDCLIGRTCAYGYIFETPIQDSATIMRKYTQAPHPFVFEPSQNGKGYVKKGDSLTHSLVVIGEAGRYLPHFFLAMEQLGSNGLGGDLVPFRVDRVTSENGSTLFEYPRKSRFDQICPGELKVEPGPSHTAVFRITYLTPARITVDGRITRTPTLVDLVKTLARRVFLLRHFHCGNCEDRLSDDFLEAAGEARCLATDFRWQDAERYSTRQKRRVPIGGIVGHLEYEGDFGLLAPLLRAGEYVHVGKNATFGLGRFAASEGGAS